jgi:hypothetical protein
MDPTDFDALTRALTQLPSRRAALRQVAGSALAGLLMIGALPIAAKKGKGKRKKKGGQRALAPGTNSPPPPMACNPPCGVCQVCSGGACLRSNDDAPCNGTGRCLQGACNARPTCHKPGSDRGFDCIFADCCGGCDYVGDVNPHAICQPSAPGYRCYDSTDCAFQPICVGYRCQKGNVGASCQQDEHCLQAHCSGGECQPGGFGAVCTTNADCSGNNCSGGQCGAGGDGAPCQTDAQCLGGECDGTFHCFG